MNPYQILHDKLAALEDKRLAKEALWDYGLKCGCAIGQVIPHEVRDGTQIAAFSIGPHGFSWRSDAIRDHLSGMGFTVKFVTEIQEVNDHYDHTDQTPEERYERVLRYLKEKSNEASQ